MAARGVCVCVCVHTCVFWCDCVAGANYHGEVEGAGGHGEGECDE